MATNDSQQGPQQSGPQQVTTSGANSGQQMGQVQQQTTATPQQIQLQQTTPQNIHNPQQHQQNQQPMQQVLIPQQYNLQNLQQLLNQGHIMLPNNIFNPNMNPQIQPAQLTSSIQVIQTKPIQNQFTHMLQPGATSYAIPTSGANNSVAPQYFIQNFQSSPLQLQQQQGKAGEMTKVIGAQLPQHLWASPQTLFTTGGQNSFVIRGSHPDQMYIQPQMTSNATSQQFSMQPIQTATSQLPTTSIAAANSAQVQQTIQQGNLQHQPQTHSIQTQSNVTMKAPANLQPKPAPLQIQPNTQQTTHQIQQQHQIQPQFQVTLTQQNPQQLQMMPQSTTSNIISQSQPQGLTATQVIQQAQQQHAQNQNQPRQLTILPQNQTVQVLQPGQVFRPNLSTTGLTVVSSQASQGTVTNGLQIPQPRQKIRKVTRVGTTTSTTILQPPRPGTTIAIQSPQQTKQFQPAVQQGQTHHVSAPLTRIPVVTTTTSQNLQKTYTTFSTLNLSAIQGNLNDATITPINPLASSQQQQQTTSTTGQSITQTPQFITIPSPSISLVPAPPPQHTVTPKKEEPKERPEIKVEKEKESKLIKSTPINGTSNGEESDEILGKQKLPKALVKPQSQVLNHIIEGFVIQESAEPFPMPKNELRINVENGEPSEKKFAMNGEEYGKCELCGKIDLKAKFKKGKRFCSSQCAKGMKKQQGQASTAKKGRSRKLGEGMDENSTDETNSSVGEASATEDHQMEIDEGRLNPVKWGVSEVVDFVKNLPGCSEYAEEFVMQEIDGQALLLLKEDHLMSAIGMKLGPALKLCAKIENLRAGAGGGGSNAEASTSSKV